MNQAQLRLPRSSWSSGEERHRKCARTIKKTPFFFPCWRSRRRTKGHYCLQLLTSLIMGKGLRPAWCRTQGQQGFTQCLPANLPGVWVENVGAGRNRWASSELTDFSDSLVLPRIGSTLREWPWEHLDWWFVSRPWEPERQKTPAVILFQTSGASREQFSSWSSIIERSWQRHWNEGPFVSLVL